MCSTSLSGDAVCLPGKKDGSEGSGSDSAGGGNYRRDGRKFGDMEQNASVHPSGSVQKETAGALFIRLAEHIPFAFLGATPWMQVENEKDFQEMVRMVDLYQEIHGGTCL